MLRGSATKLGQDCESYLGSFMEIPAGLGYISAPTVANTNDISVCSAYYGHVHSTY